MASLHSITIGEDTEFKGRLARAGFSAEVIREINRNDDMAEVMYEALMRHPCFTLVHGFFITTAKQIERVREWNREFGWSIPDEAFAEAEKSVPAWPEEKLVAVVLVPYLADKVNEDGTVTTGLDRTFHELWTMAAKQQYANWRWDGYDNASSDRLRLLKGIEHKVGLRWEIIDLGCQRNKKPMDVRSSKSSPSAGILAAAALHPNWVKSMNGDKVPYVWIPATRCRFPAGTRGSACRASASTTAVARSSWAATGPTATTRTGRCLRSSGSSSALGTRTLGTRGNLGL